MDHRHSSRQDLRIRDVGDTQARIEKLLDQLVSVLLQHVVIVAEAVDDGGKEARVADRLDVALNRTAELLRYGAGGKVQRERLGRVHVKEHTGEHDRHDHEHLVLGEDALGVLFRLQRQGEHLGGEVDGSQIAQTNPISKGVLRN